MSFLNNLFSGMTGYIDEIPKDAVLVDVRNPDEHAQGIIQGSVLLPLGSLHQQTQQQLPNKDVPIVVYCAAGMRTMSARRELLNMGYQPVYNGKSIHQVAKQTGKPIVSSKISTD